MGDYVRAFVPELSRLGDSEIAAMHGGGTGIGGYPAPLVGHQEARSRALAAWESLRA